MTRDDFERFITEAVESLPEEFAKRLDNVEFILEEWPSREHLTQAGVGPGQSLYGLYQGVPLTRRGQYNAALPDKISIFAGPILATTGNNFHAVKEQVKHTVLHEIGHYFGMSEDQIRKAQRQ